MKPISGKPVGDVQKYKGREIQAWFYGPDFLVLINGDALNIFYQSAEAARQGAMRYIDVLTKKSH